MPEFLTENTYESIPTNGRPPFTWEFGNFRAWLSIDYFWDVRIPRELSISYETWPAWGFPKIWDSTSTHLMHLDLKERAEIISQAFH